MISEKDIAQALRLHLETMPDRLPTSWDNKDLEKIQRPYLVSEIVRTGRTSRRLDGTGVKSRGFFMVTVVIERGSWATTAEAEGDRLLDHFAHPLSLDVPGGKVKSTKPPELKQGYPDGPNYRLPVRIDYLAE